MLRRRRKIKAMLVIKSHHTERIVDEVQRAYPVNSPQPMMAERARRLMSCAAVMAAQGREVATSINDTYLGTAIQRGVDLGALIRSEEEGD